jgi:hypothetical protein
LSDSSNTPSANPLTLPLVTAAEGAAQAGTTIQATFIFIGYDWRPTEAQTSEKAGCCEENPSTLGNGNGLGIRPEAESSSARSNS